MHSLPKFHLKHSSEAKLGGRVRDAASKDLVKRQLQGLSDNMPDFMDLKTGRLTTKKAKKEKSAEEECMAEVKKLAKKLLDQSGRGKNILFV